MRGLELAKLELAGGRHRLARERLKSLLTAVPLDIEVRVLLAEAYRLDNQPTEAGRWGYLIGSAATEAERDAFVRHCELEWTFGSVEARLRHLLRCADLNQICDADGQRILAQLRVKRRPVRTRERALQIASDVCARRGLPWRDLEVRRGLWTWHVYLAGGRKSARKIVFVARSDGHVWIHDRRSKA